MRASTGSGMSAAITALLVRSLPVPQIDISYGLSRSGHKLSPNANSERYLGLSYENVFSIKAIILIVKSNYFRRFSLQFMSDFSIRVFIVCIIKGKVIYCLNEE